MAVALSVGNRLCTTYQYRHHAFCRKLFYNLPQTEVARKVVSAVAETYYSTLIEDLARPAVKESYPLVGGQRSYKKYAAVCLEAQQVHSLMMMMALFCLSKRTPLLTHFFPAHSSHSVTNQVLEHFDRLVGSAKPSPPVHHRHRRWLIA